MLDIEKVRTLAIVLGGYFCFIAMLAVLFLIAWKYRHGSHIGEEMVVFALIVIMVSGMFYRGLVSGRV